MAGIPKAVVIIVTHCGICGSSGGCLYILQNEVFTTSAKVRLIGQNRGGRMRAGGCRKLGLQKAVVVCRIGVTENSTCRNPSMQADYGSIVRRPPL